MITQTKRPLSLPAVIAIFGWILAGPLKAQNLTVLHTFTGSDGRGPEGGMILSGNTLYGTTYQGGNFGYGTVFKVNTDGTGFMNLHHFTAPAASPATNGDGANPPGGLAVSGNTLYGTTEYGGASGFGTVFAVNTDGTAFTVLHTFPATSGAFQTNSDGGNPFAGLVLSGGTLYGTANDGGSSGGGTVFALSTDGSGFRTLHNFIGLTDGALPVAGLVLSGSTLYGTTAAGNFLGAVFAINIDGAGFTNLHSFTGGADGGQPQTGLTVSGNTLYGTTSQGGSASYGTVFSLNTNGTAFITLYNFAGFTNGTLPRGELVLSGHTLCGTVENGGALGFGAVFAFNTDGTRYTNLYSFTAHNDGANPLAPLILSGNTLYGTASQAGNLGDGTVFSLSLPPQLAIVPSGNRVVVTWPTNATGFSLQSTTNPASPGAWTPVPTAPFLVNGQYTVTNPISGNQQFYRLTQ
jgi:uncharacterized repeat protein (TIGR03803 family)